MTFQRGQSGRPKSAGSSVFGKTTMWSQRSRPWVHRGSPRRSHAAVAGLAGLPDRMDRAFATAADLAPGLAVVPDLAALDLDADDAGALDGDDEVDLVVLEVVGDPLSGHDKVIGLKLINQRLVGAALGCVEPRVFVGRDAHRREPPNRRRALVISPSLGVLHG